MTSKALGVLLFLAVASLAGSAPHAGPLPACAPQPRQSSFIVPKQGLAWDSGEEFKGPCQAFPSDQWVRRKGKPLDLFVQAQGPEGSGRYWEIAVGLGSQMAAVPTRGFCLRGTTLGWRTLQAFDGPLFWVDDGDGDSWPEFVLWDSFPLGPEESPAEFGLTAWVYELDGNETLVLDLGLSRTLARRVARAYDKPLEGRPKASQLVRQRASRALTAFADNACHVEHGA